MTSVLVVGGGVIGFSTALHLLQRGVRVSIIDYRPAQSASRGNQGWIAPALMQPSGEPSVLNNGIRGMFDPSSAVYVAPTLDVSILRFVAAFEGKRRQGRSDGLQAAFEGLNDQMLEPWGNEPFARAVRHADPFTLGFPNIESRDRYAASLEVLKASGADISFTAPGSNEMRVLEPALGPGVAGVLQLAGQRFVDAEMLLDGLQSAVEELGGTVHEDTEVQQIQAFDDRVALKVRDGQAIPDADAVVIASGAWLNQLARPFGVRTRIAAGRGYSYSVTPEVMPRGPIYFPGQRLACTPLGDRMRVAGSMEFAASTAPLDGRRIDRMARIVGPMLASAPLGEPRDLWVGSRPCSVDGLPVVGRTRSPRVFVAGGHGRWGMAWAPLTGKLLADQMIDHVTSPLLQRLDPTR